MSRLDDGFIAVSDGVTWRPLSRAWMIAVMSEELGEHPDFNRNVTAQMVWATRMVDRLIGQVKQLPAEHELELG
jgi:hypothetical protein